ncbi:MAG: hypothetical protein ACYTF6_08280 [Planctomycetota bacterium]
MEKRIDTRSVRVIVCVGLAAAVAAACCAGCNASGYPSFVKISPDSRYVIYHDSAYPKTYVYDTREDRKSVFDGRIACVDERASRLLLRTGPGGSDMSCRLIELQQDGPRLVELPALPMEGAWTARIMLAEREGGLLALLYESSWAKKPTCSKRLKDTDGRWDDSEVPDEFQDKPLWAVPEPVGGRLSGHVYMPLDRSFDLPEEQSEGLDVDLTVGDGFPVRKITSPDGTYVVAIGDAQDVWHRFWLTESATGRRVLLLEKNDAPYEVIRAIVNFPGGLLLALFAPF